MTTREKAKSFLTDNGMFDSQAEEVMLMAMPQIEKLAEGYQITWNRPSEEYPPQLFSLWNIVLSECAVEWIDRNVPQTWCRPLFEQCAHKRAADDQS